MAVSLVMSAADTPAPLNANSTLLPGGFIAKVDAKKVKFGPDTVTSTLPPFWVSVTVPNGDGPQPASIWHEERLPF